MTDQEWETIALLLSKGWKGDLGTGEDRAYRILLDGYTAEQVITAMRKLLATGSPFLPAASEIVQAIHKDPDRPVFAEAFSMLYDSHPPCGGRGVLWASDRNAALDRAFDIHPLLGAFAQCYGIDRLRMLEVDHDQHASLVRRDLEHAWENFVEANAHRDAAALATGRRRELRRSPTRFDPAAVLGIDRERIETEKEA